MSWLSIQLEPFDSKYIDGVMEIETLSFSTPWSREAYKHILRDQRSQYFVAVSEDKVVGFSGIRCVLDEANLDNIAVHPDYRQQGVARRMLHQLIKLGDEMELRFMTLEVRASNKTALELYKSFGFYQVGTRRAYYKDPEEDAVLMDYDYKRE